jgi:hypothetical protein
MRTNDVPGKKVEATDRERFGAEDLQKELSPVTHVAKGKNIPPFLILHIVDPVTRRPTRRRRDLRKRSGQRASR